MANTFDPFAGQSQPTLEQLFANFNREYLARSGQKSADTYPAVGNSGALVSGAFGTQVQKLALANLYKQLMDQGRVDPRLLARAQAQNSARTQQQADTTRGMLAKRGVGGGGFSDALLGSINAAGSERAAGLDYQNISDSYARNQQNLGLADQLAFQPALGYAALGEQARATRQDAKNKELAAGVSLISGGLGALLK